MKKIIKNLFIFILVILMIFIFYNLIFIKYRNKINFEKSILKINESSQNSPFSISKIVMYSSAYGKNKNTTFKQSNWILDILQYTDIAIYISHSGDNLNLDNTVKKLSLENIKLSSPKVGLPSLYYLDSLNFGTPNIDENNQLDNSLEFTVLNDENKNNDIQFNTPVFFTDCSNPITLKYVNQTVKENYTITSNESVFLNGKLLKIADIPLNDLIVNISFIIQIENNNDEKYYYNLSVPINLENNHSSIYDGSILIDNEYENYKFLKGAVKNSNL